MLTRCLSLAYPCGLAVVVAVGREELRVSLPKVAQTPVMVGLVNNQDLLLSQTEAEEVVEQGVLMARLAVLVVTVVVV